MSNELEEEFFRVEGRPTGSPACEYVFSLMRTPDGGPIGARERAALWYIAYSVRDGIAQISISNLADHLFCDAAWMKDVLRYLMDHGVLALVPESGPLDAEDICSLVFVELQKAEA